jgi:hypothetical protein
MEQCVLGQKYLSRAALADLFKYAKVAQRFADQGNPSTGNSLASTITT